MDTDVAVVGYGPVGRLAALLLGRRGQPWWWPNARPAVIVLAAEPGEGQVADTTGAYAAWLAALGAVAVLIRPDLYLYGAAADAADLIALLGHLRDALQAPGPPASTAEAGP